MASRHDILSVLQDVQSGALTPEDALTRLKLAPFEDLGYAKVDYHRAVRQGVPEVIYGQSKTKEQISGILAAMEKRGCVNIKLMVLLAAPEGIEHIQKTHPDVDIYCGAVDDHLNEHGYIVPGLGDAGDRIFGTK